VDWVDHQAKTAKPYDRQAVQALTFELSGVIPGKNWISRFEKRHPEVQSSRPSNLDPKRAQNFNPTNIRHYYNLLKAIYDAHPNLPPQHIWNMDEKGLQLGGGRKRAKKYYHLRSMKKSQFYRIHSDNLELVTIIECISPSGLSIPPSFVLSAGPIPALINLDVEIGAVATSPNGWTDNEIGADWFKHTFVPFATAHKMTDDPILLPVDGHDSHETDKLREVAYEHDIIVITFPSKCTHKLQPLDVVVFAQTQHNWSNHCDRRIYKSTPMTRHNVIQEYMMVCSASMTPELCSSAFSYTGIYPFNPNIFTDDDFAPTKSFSNSMHAPQTFPAEAPSSSPLPSDLSNCDISSEGSDDTNTDSEGLPIAEGARVPVQLDWDTDPDDPDYEPPADNVSASSATCPPASASAASGLLLSPATSIMQPFTPSGPTTRSTMPRVSYEPSKDFSIDPDCISQPSHPFTRSQKQSSESSPAVSVSVALDHSRAPIPSSIEKKDFEINRLQMTVNLMEKEFASTVNQMEEKLTQAKAQIDASNAHCTIMMQAATEAKAELEQQKCKTHRVVKTSAHYVTHPMIRA
jgi:DDE superfamily endonuclease